MARACRRRAHGRRPWRARRGGRPGPTRRARSMASGDTGEERVGALVDRAAGERSRCGACRRDRSASSTTTFAPASRRWSRRGEAGDAAAHDCDEGPRRLRCGRSVAVGRAGARDRRVGSRGARGRAHPFGRPRGNRGSSLSDRVRANASPTSSATPSGLDVEVVAAPRGGRTVKPCGAHQRPRRRRPVPPSSRMTSRMSGPAPRLGGGARALPGRWPSRPTGQRRPGRRPRRALLGSWSG